MAKVDYLELAKARITTPGQSKRMPRILVYGRNKKGKTRFASSAPDVLVIDPETGTQHERQDLPVWPVTNWTDLTDVYNYLRLGKHPYKWVVLDGLTKMNNMALKFVMSQEEERDLTRKPGFVEQRDYGKSGELLKSMLNNFHLLKDVGLVLTAQERLEAIAELDPVGEEDDDASQVKYMFVPDLPKAPRAAVNTIVDVIGRIYVVKGEFETEVRTRSKATGEITTKLVTREGLQRRLWVGPHDTYDTGYRSRFVLPDSIHEPTVPSLVKAMRDGVKK